MRMPEPSRTWAGRDVWLLTMQPNKREDVSKEHRCPIDGESETCDAPVFKGSDRHGKYIPLCVACGLPVALWKRIKAAMDLSLIVQGSPTGGAAEQRLAEIVRGGGRGK